MPRPCASGRTPSVGVAMRRPGVGLADLAEVTNEGQQSRTRNAHGDETVARAGSAVGPLRVRQDALDATVTLSDDHVLLGKVPERHLEHAATSLVRLLTIADHLVQGAEALE